MTSSGAPLDEGGLDALFESSPDFEVHTSAAAEAAFLLGIVAVVAAPFSVMHTVALGAAAVGTVLALVGIATTSRPNVAGGFLAPAGLTLGIAVLLFVGLRYLGIDTAAGDGMLPTIEGWLEDLNALIPQP